MSNNQMVPVEKILPVLANKKTDVLLTPVVAYGLLDHMHYSFSCNVSDDITIHMEEAENASSKTGFVDIEFHDAVPESYKVYYAVAAASGALTGALSHFSLGEDPDLLVLGFCIIFTLIFSLIGAKIANRVSAKTLNRVVGIILLFITALIMIPKII
jgi:hypothetical protein